MFYTAKKKNKQLKIISSKDLKLQSINLPIDTTDYLRIESILQKGKEKFLVSIGYKSFLVDENGNYVKATSKGVYYGKKIIIGRKDAFDTYEMEVLIMK